MPAFAFSQPFLEECPHVFLATSCGSEYFKCYNVEKIHFLLGFLVKPLAGLKFSGYIKDIDFFWTLCLERIRWIVQGREKKKRFHDSNRTKQIFLFSNRGFMMKKFKCVCSGLALLASICLSGTSQADLVVISEDFSAGGSTFTQFPPQDFFLEVANWSESANTGFGDFLLANTDAGAIDDDNDLTAGVQGGGYLYREIGTNSSFASLNVSGVNHFRLNTSDAASLIVDVYSLNDGGAADLFDVAGTDIATFSGADLVGSFEAAAPTNQGDDPLAFNFDYDFDGVAEDARIFVRFSVGDQAPNSTANAIAYFDNLTFSAVAVPEPSSAILFALGCCGSVLTRRRKK